MVSVIPRAHVDALSVPSARAAIDRIAERRGIDIVYRFVPGDTAFDAETHDQAMLSIETRTALRYPTELDITADVLAEIGGE